MIQNMRARIRMFLAHGMPECCIVVFGRHCILPQSTKNGIVSDNMRNLMLMISVALVARGRLALGRKHGRARCYLSSAERCFSFAVRASRSCNDIASTY